MGFASHRGTTGHSIGKSIIGKDDGQRAELSGEHTNSMTPEDAGTVTSFHGKRAANGGWSITHTPTTPRPEAPAEEQMHVFRDAEEAHSHLGALMGVTAVRVGSGERRD